MQEVLTFTSAMVIRGITATLKKCGTLNLIVFAIFW